MEKPNRCYIRQEWFEAVSFLPPEDRCAFYEALMSFVYYGTQRDTLPPSVRGMLEMAKPTLQKDMLSYNQKLITNRQNGSNGGRPRGDITQKNPEEPKKTQKTHIYNIHKHIQESLTTLSTYEDAGERKKDILIELFARGCGQPLAEANKMCDYYDARGWVDKGGNPIKDVAALARVWKCESTSTYFANVRKKWVRFCKSIRHILTDEIVTDFVRMEKKNIDGKDTCIIYCTSETFVQSLEKNAIEALRASLTVWGCKSITYRLQTPEIAKKSLLEAKEVF